MTTLALKRYKGYAISVSNRGSFRAEPASAGVPELRAAWSDNLAELEAAIDGAVSAEARRRRVNLQIPCCFRLGNGTMVRGLFRGIHGGNGDALVAGSDGDKGRLSMGGSHGSLYRPMPGDLIDGYNQAREMWEEMQDRVRSFAISRPDGRYRGGFTAERVEEVQADVVAQLDGPGDEA